MKLELHLSAEIASICSKLFLYVEQVLGEGFALSEVKILKKERLAASHFHPYPHSAHWSFSNYTFVFFFFLPTSRNSAVTFCLSTTLSHFDLEPHIDNLSDPDPSSHMNYLNPFTAFISTFHHTQAPFLPNNNPLWWQGFTPTAFMLSIANHRVEFPKQLPLSWMASTLQNSCGYMAAFHNKLANKKYLLRLIYFRRQIKKWEHF